MGRFNPKLAQWVNSNLSFRDEYKAIFGKELDYGTCYCPFHANTDTKAAKLYGNWLKCYGECQRSYSVYDLLCKFNPDRLRELRYSGVLPEQGVVFRNDVKPVVFPTLRRRIYLRIWFRGLLSFILSFRIFNECFAEEDVGVRRWSYGGCHYTFHFGDVLRCSGF